MKTASFSVAAVLLAAASPQLGSPSLPPWAERLGWTLVHSAWQLAAIGLLAALVLRVARSRSANARYVIGVALLGLMVVAPAATWSVIPAPTLDITLIAQPAGDATARQIEPLPVNELPAEAGPSSNSPDLIPPAAERPRTATVRPTAVSEPTAAGWSDQIGHVFMQVRDLIAPRLPLLVTLWSLGVLLCSIRPALGLWMHWRLKSRGLTVVPPKLQARFTELARRLGVRHAVRIAESALVKVPLVVGYLRPLVLLPASVLSGLPAPQLEAVLAHELAHIRRHDWVINALQVLVETLLFYHPAAWWLSRRIHHERELCCDDLALEVVGDRATYGRALLALENLRQTAPTPLLAATGGELVTRVRRLLPDEPRTAGAPRSWLGGLSMVVLLFAAGSASLLLQSPARSMNDETPATNGATKEAKAEAGVTKTLRNPHVLLPDHWIMQAVEYDRGGKELATASLQGGVTIRRWDVVGLKLLSEIKLQADKHGRSFRQGTLKFSGDRTRVVAATDEYVGIWDATTGELLKQLSFPPKEGIYDCAINQLDCTPDLSVIVGHRALPGRLTLSYDAHLLVWDGRSGEALQTVVDKGATDLKSLDLSPDGSRLVTTNGGGAKIWETATGKLLQFIANDNKGRKHPEPDVSSLYNSHVWSVQFSLDGKQVALGDNLGVKLFDAASGRLLRELEGPYRYSSSSSPGLVFSRDGRWLARLGTQEAVEGEQDKHRYVVPIWSTQTGEKSCVLHTEAAHAAFSDDGRTLAVASSDMQQAVSLWQLNATDGAPPAGPGPHSGQDRVEENGHYVGAKAAEYIEQFKPVWGEPTLGIQYGIAFTSQTTRFQRGQRVPLVYFFRNVSDQPVNFETSPDYLGNTPIVVNASGEKLAASTLPLLGHVARYVETLQPGEALGPFYSNLGLGENPRPRRQHWSPALLVVEPGKYRVSHAAPIGLYIPNAKNGQTERIVTPAIEFEVVAANPAQGAKPNKQTATQAPAPAQPPRVSTPELGDDGVDRQAAWGAVANGLRMRVVPVDAAMSDEAIQLTPRGSMFETLDDVTLAVEIENASDAPVSLRDLRYGEHFGDSSGKRASDWFGQFLFSIDYYDAAGQLLERPKLIPIRQELTTGGDALTATLQPKQTLRMLLRPTRWLSALSQQPLIGQQRAVVKYNGAVAGAGVGVVSQVEAPAVEYTVRKRGYRPAGVAPAKLGDDPQDDPELVNDIVPQLKWGAPVNGLRAALDIVPEGRFKVLSHGTKPKLRMVVQNVSDKPVTLASLMWLSELPINATNAQGEALEVQRTWYSGITPVVRVELKPQQIVTFDAGNLGLAATKERAEKFEHVTHRKLVAPQGKYSLTGTERFGTSFQLKDGDGKVLVPQDGDFRGELTTGAASLALSNELIECEIRDAVTGKLVDGTTVSFLIVKPKTANSDEIILANLIWGPKAPAHPYFTIPTVPEDIAQRPDRDELVIRYGVGGRDDYEPFAPRETIPLKQFFHEGPRQAQQVLGQIKLTPKKQQAKPNPLPEGLKQLEGQGVSANYDAEGQVISLYLGRPTTDAMLAELTALPRLRELHVETTKGVTVEGVAHLSKLTQLEKASFYNVNEQGAELGDAVIRSVAGLKALRELSVSECGTTDEGCRVLARMTQLTSLSLHQEGRLTDAALKPIGALTQLKSLSLGSVVATERLGRMQFSAEGLASLRELRELESLHLHGHPVTADILVSNKLRDVSLGHSAVDDAVAKRLAELGNLRQLNLSFTNITDEGLKQLGALQQLQHLDVASYIATDACVAAFERHPTLRYVNLRLSKLSDVGVQSVATIPGLTNLSLWGVPQLDGGPGPALLTIEGLRPLVAAPNLRTLSFTNWQSRGRWLALRELKQLEHLSFLMCDVSSSEVEALDEALPETLIVNATGGGGVQTAAALAKQERLQERARKRAAESTRKTAPAADDVDQAAAPAEVDRGMKRAGRRLLATPKEPDSAPAYELQFAGDDLLVSAGQDAARVWDVETGNLRHVLPHEKGRMIRGLAVSPDQRLLATSGFDDKLAVWDLTTGRRLHSLKGHGLVGGWRAVQFTRDGGQFASWGDDARLRSWDAQAGKLLAEHDLRLPGFAEQGQLAAISAGMPGVLTRDGKSLFVRFKEELIEFDVGSGRVVRRVNTQLDPQPLAASADGKWLAGVQSERDARREYLRAKLVLLDRATLQPVREWPVTEPAATATDQPTPRPILVGGGDRTLAFTPDSRRLAWTQSGAREQIVIADVSRDRITHRITSDSAICCLEFSPQGEQLATGNLDSSITLWDWQHPTFVANSAAPPGRNREDAERAAQPAAQDPASDAGEEAQRKATAEVTPTKGEVVSSSSDGRWQATPDVELQLDPQLFHGADVMTTAVLRWKASEQSAERHCRVQMTSDAFGNRHSFLAAWETGRPVLWFVTGWPKRGNMPPGEAERTKAETLHKVDFSNRMIVVDHWYDGWPEEESISDEVKDKLNERFDIKPQGKESYRYLQTTLPGAEPTKRDIGKIAVFLDADRKCRATDLRPGQPPEVACTIDTLAQTLQPIIVRLRAFEAIGPEGSLHVLLGHAPDYPANDLREVLTACGTLDVFVPRLQAASELADDVDGQPVP